MTPSPVRRRLSALGAVAVATFASVALAHGSVSPRAADAAGARALADALNAQAGLVTGAGFAAAPGEGTPFGVADSALGGFPRDGSTFAILTNGNVELADDPNGAPDSDAQDGGQAVRGETDVDVTVLRIDVTVPRGHNCLAFDFAFFSEEYPEYIGNSFNDAFVAELDSSTWTTDGIAIVAPRNFAFDAAGNAISVNAAGAAAMSAENAAGTTYDGATPLLAAATPVTTGAHTLYLSIFDQVDPFFDSAVFLDNLRTLEVTVPASDCRGGARPPEPGPPAGYASFFAFPPGFHGGVFVGAGDVNRDGKADVVAGAGAGGGPHVRVFDGVDGRERQSFFAYPSGFAGGVRVAAGDVNGDGTDDIVTGAGPGGGPHVRVFDGRNGDVLHSFYAFSPDFTSGVFVAAGDVNGDGRDDIIAGAGAGGGPHVKVFNPVDGKVMASFFAYPAGFAGGVYVASGDVNGDGKDDVVTGAGAGGGPHVKAFNGAGGDVLASFFAYSPGFVGGVRVAAGDVNADGKEDIVTGPGPGGGPHVQAFSGADGSVIASFIAYASGFTGGVYVGAGDVDGDRRADVVTGTGAGGGPHVKVFTGVAP